MPFNQKPQKFNAKINAVTIGSGDKTVTIGGENSFPFYTFDAPTAVSYTHLDVYKRQGLSFIDFFHQFHNLFVVGTNFFY